MLSTFDKIRILYHGRQGAAVACTESKLHPLLQLLHVDQRFSSYIHISELNFIQLSLPVEQTRHSGVQYNSPCGHIHCYLFIWFSALDVVCPSTLSAAVCFDINVNSPQNLKLFRIILWELRRSHFFLFFVFCLLLLFCLYFYVISSCLLSSYFVLLVLLSTKWIPFAIQNVNKKNKKYCFATKIQQQLESLVELELNFHRVIPANSIRLFNSVWMVHDVSHETNFVAKKNRKKKKATRKNQNRKPNEWYCQRRFNKNSNWLVHRMLCVGHAKSIHEAVFHWRRPSVSFLCVD